MSYIYIYIAFLASTFVWGGGTQQPHGVLGAWATSNQPPKADIDRYLVIHVATTCDEHGVYVTKDSAEVIEIGWLLASAAPGVNFQITDQLRRTKGVLFTRTEVIIGTKDNSRTLVRQREITTPPDWRRTFIPRAREQSTRVLPLRTWAGLDDLTLVLINTATLAAHHPHEDKQELERQRLLGLASVLPLDAYDDGAGPSQGPQPSAPILFENDQQSVRLFYGGAASVETDDAEHEQGSEYV